MQSFQGVLFDMDGTLIDNMMLHHSIWKDFLSELGLHYTLDEVRRSIHGVNTEILERLFPNQYNQEELEALGNLKEQKYREVYRDKIELIPGAKDFLTQLKKVNIPMAIGTAAPEENARFAVEQLHLQTFFPSVIHSGSVNQGKPNPEVFQKAADAIQIPLQDCLVFEDSPTGAMAAENGGAHCIVLTTTHSPDEFEGNTSILDFIPDFTHIDQIISVKDQEILFTSNRK